MIEQILNDLYTSAPSWNIIILRYFNPVGAHPSGLIGENPNGIPNNLMLYITQVASGKLEKLHIFGDDYDTKDGTGVRDYIHVVDLAREHVKALDILERTKPDKPRIYNLGTGHGYSVLEIVQTFNGVKIPYTIDPRRHGNVAVCYSDPSKAINELGWMAKYGVEDMCRNSWLSQKTMYIKIV